MIAERKSLAWLHMKTGRRSFLKKAGALLGGLTVVGASTSPSPKYQQVVLSQSGRKKTFKVHRQLKPVKFTLDMPAGEVRIEGFDREPDGALSCRPYHFVG